jgi:sterol desaturase/sphingolipid hydroxylase (fatty acid hydroxylase superfamily)
VGVLAPDVGLWYHTLLTTFGMLCGGCLSACAVLQLLSGLVGTQIQHDKRFKPALVVEEARETALTMYMVACFASWPVMQAQQGHPTAMVHAIQDAVPYARQWGLSPTACAGLYALKFAGIVLGADCWTYWKHRSLHNRVLWVFHKPHHAYHDPTCFAGFALHPFEGVLTFAPILLFCNSSLGIYAPMHWPMLGFFSLLNFYLHCGHRITLLETWLPKAWVNTSVWHNRHHEKTKNHYGEMLSVWDHLCGTIPTAAAVKSMY